MATHGGNICRLCSENINDCECENDRAGKNGTTEADREFTGYDYEIEPQSDYEAILAAETAYRLSLEVDAVMQPDNKIVKRIQFNALLIIDKALKNLKKSYD